MFDIVLSNPGSGFNISLSSVGGTTGQIKVWLSGAWVAKPIKQWNGSSWVTKPLKFYNGSTFITTSY